MTGGLPSDAAVVAAGGDDAPLRPGAARAGRASLGLLGARSPEVLLAQPCRALARTLSHARLGILPGQGHVAHVTAPELLAREVSAFLRE
ncbi:MULTISPECIES: alpha/beta fold hydrolase [Myxococcus]|uniref:alpha/beta fold hydrolase n=1 Tax=Myxococcus TaxID=32 RepID=UPI001127FB84|nr:MULTISPECIES: hypothetical protein [Myxococcus]WAM26573.1 hypothetical protein OZ403_00205 [Myxococcus sp. NMCA1]